MGVRTVLCAGPFRIYMNGCGMPKAGIIHYIRKNENGSVLENIFECEFFVFRDVFQ